MANKKTVTIAAVWSDSAGRRKKQTFNLELLQPTAGEVDLNTITSNAIAVLQKEDALSDAKIESAECIIPLNVATGAMKGSADADSSAREHALTFFVGVPGENGRTELVEIHVPNPKESKIDLSGVRDRLKQADTDVSNFISSVISKAYTNSGESIASYKGSFIRQRVVTKRSKQAA